MTCWVTVNDTLGNEQALVDMLADTVPEMEDRSLGDTQGSAEALVDTRADKVPELEAVKTGDTLGDVHALNDLLSDSWRHTGQCEDSGQHGG